MTNTATTFVPFISTAQIGNEGEKGYREFQQVEILAEKQVPGLSGGKLYLIKKVDDEEWLGTAILSKGYEHGEIKGEYYCTDARLFGSKAQTWTNIRTREDAMRSLGF